VVFAEGLKLAGSNVTLHVPDGVPAGRNSNRSSRVVVLDFFTLFFSIVFLSCCVFCRCMHQKTQINELAVLTVNDIVIIKSTQSDIVFVSRFVV
jgi:hypothetical protein